MADNDDFEIIDDVGLSNEQIFEFIDVNDSTSPTINHNQPQTPEPVLPLLIPKPLTNEVPQITQEQQQQPMPLLRPAPPPIIIPSKPHVPIQTTTVSAPLVIQTTTTISFPPPKIIPPVPSLPKAPFAQRYGDAAEIPHDENVISEIDAAINRSKTIQQTILHINSQQQQDIQTILEQRRHLFSTK